MRKILVLFFIILAFIIGLLVGATYSPRQVEKEEYKYLGRTIQDLQINYHLHLENKSMPEEIIGWITVRNFTTFIIAVKDVLKPETLFYAYNERGMPYFWFQDIETSLYWRYDLG